MDSSVHGEWTCEPKHIGALTKNLTVLKIVIRNFKVVMSATLVLNNENSSMNRKKFSVVHFKSDDKVEAVPSSWINEENQCYWPKTSLPNLKKVLQDSAFKPGVDWVKYDVEVIKSYGK